MGKYVPDPQFVSRVERIAVGGLRGINQGPRRRRRTTLMDAGRDMVESAKRIVDMPANKTQRRRGGLPGYSQSGRHRANDGIRRSREREGHPSYRSSFRAYITRVGTRLAVVVENTSPSARYVEYGNGQGGTRIDTTSKYQAIPITAAKYRQLKRAGARKPHRKTGLTNRAFPGKDRQGRYVLWTRVVKTYSGYGILRRAMHSTAVRYFQ